MKSAWMLSNVQLLDALTEAENRPPDGEAGERLDALLREAGTRWWNQALKVTKEDLLEKYAERVPKRFVQYDCFDPPTYPVGGCGVDEDGHELWGRMFTYELMRSSNVRVLIEPTMDAAEAAAMLRKIAAWVERDGLPDEPDPDNDDIPF